MAEEELPTSVLPEVLTGQGLEEAGTVGDTKSPKVAVGGSHSGEGAISGGASSKVLVVHKVAPPWDPLCSPDWDKESHSKEALLRIKRYRDSYLQVCYK